MAIDNAIKRRSIFPVLPAPDTAISASDRRSVLWNYGGIVTATARRVWLAVSAVTSTWRGSGAGSASWKATGAAPGTWVKPNEVEE